MKIKMAVFTGDINDPSSRYRIRQYEKVLSENDILLKDYMSNIGKYPPKNKMLRPIWIILIMMERILQVIHSKYQKYDITFLQREMISTLSTFERYCTKPIIFDVDDAIHLRSRTSKSINNICHHVDAIICGNEYLYNYYRKYGKKTYIIPTSIDTDIYTPKDIKRDGIVIGWIGTSSNFESLYKIQDAIKIIMEKYSSVVFRVVSNEKPTFSNNLEYQFIQWSSENEVSEIQDFNIGIMPLIDNDWSKGKCSFKMIQYMSCGKAVVVSPVGMNSKVFSLGEIGFAPSDYFEGWINAIEKLIRDKDLREQMGKEGRRIVLEHYSTRACSLKLVKAIYDVIENNTINIEDSVN